ncbi:MAG: DUF1016 domain-containing protein [Verrucomicrobiota bacterium]|nr:DUF1016 domain-containing protein [Verrucomicrobiota bacterium]
MLKSGYNLEFLGIGRALKERELEDKLIERLQEFILELGYGLEFALKTKANPIGVAEYQLQSQLPAEFKGRLPTRPATRRRDARGFAGNQVMTQR